MVLIYKNSHLNSEVVDINIMQNKLISYENKFQYLVSSPKNKFSNSNLFFNNLISNNKFFKIILI